MYHSFTPIGVSVVLRRCCCFSADVLPYVIVYFTLASRPGWWYEIRLSYASYFIPACCSASVAVEIRFLSSS